MKSSKINWSEVRELVLFLVVGLLMILYYGTASAETNYQQFVEPQAAWVTCAQSSVRSEPNEKAKLITKLSNGQYMAVLGKVNGTDGNEYFVVSLKSVGLNQNGVGYVNRAYTVLGVKRYVKMPKDTKVFPMPFLTNFGCPAEISSGQVRPIIGEIITQDGAFYCIQVEADHRGVGFVLQTDVSAPYEDPADTAWLNQLKSGYFTKR